MGRESIVATSGDRKPGPGGGYRGLSRARRAFVGLLLGLLAFLLLAEIAVRATGFVDLVNPFPRKLYVSTEVADLPYRLRPGVVLDVRGSHVEVNELGMRERPVTAPGARSRVERILVLGDSVAFGWLQPVEQAFGRQLETELARRGVRAEVLNAGVPGYNAAAEAAWLREYGTGLAPDIVIVAVNLNDFDRTPRINSLGILSTEDDEAHPWSPTRWSELYLAAHWVALRARGDTRILAGPTPTAAPEAGADRWDRFDRYVSTLRKRFYRDPKEPEWTSLVEAWRDIARRGRKLGARVLFALFPDGDQIGVPDPDLGPQAKLLALCAAERLECIDLTPAFAADGRVLHSDIMHPNDAGHALAGAVVAAELQRGRATLSQALDGPHGVREALPRGEEPGPGIGHPQP